MNDIQSMWDYLKDNAKDDTAKRGLADLYQETGNDEMAYTLRWCVRHRRWPKKGSYWKHYYFCAGPYYKEYKSQGNSIATALVKYAEWNRIQLTGKSEQEAIENLCSVLKEIKALLEA